MNWHQRKKTFHFLKSRLNIIHNKVFENFILISYFHWWGGEGGCVSFSKTCVFCTFAALKLITMSHWIISVFKKKVFPPPNDDDVSIFDKLRCGYPYIVGSLNMSSPFHFDLYLNTFVSWNIFLAYVLDYYWHIY